MHGLLAYGIYVPHYRLDRAALGQALGVSAGKGTRSVASYDEDSTSMGVEAARAALRMAPGVTPAAVCFATTDPGYLDKTNATAIHAALALPANAGAFDMIGSVRSGAGALRAALDARRPTLAVLSDVRTGLPAGGDEREGGDGAAAFLCGDDVAGTVIAEPIAFASASAEFLDRWRVPGESASRQWEERFGEHVYLPLAKGAVAEALKQAGIEGSALHHVIVAGPHGRAAKGAARAVGAKPEALGDDLTGVIGNLGTAHAGVLLADALDRASADQLIAVVSLADGADVTIWRTTGALTERRPALSVAKRVAGGAPVGYATFLTWRGVIKREPPRRPDPEPPAAPPSFRGEDWKFGFTGSRCQACGARHVPPARVCVKCHAVDRMTPERLADVAATIATFTIDRLAYSLSPPVVAAVIDFDGGGRFQCEMTDVDPKAVKIGDRVEMTFRKLYTASGVHNYFWKARPIRS
ncbi:MAG: hydroxymethylglutaryl-CoA synthase family protein [Candidatus Rokubacteria bacterium]|nr:hydroxymethylglutaryl-CoA synthase family protein [Candidatus Rokubacteria bacterium]